MKVKTQEQNEVELKEGSSAKDLAEALKLTSPHQSLAAKVNGKIVDLSTPLREGDEVHLITFEEAEGKEIFWHTSAHVLAQAVLRLYPDAKPTIGPPIENGFYYDFANLHISDEDLPKIEKEMKKIVSEGHTSERFVFSSKEDAKKEFAANPYKIELINEIPGEESLTGYRQGEFFDLCRGPHLPNLGKIKALKVMKTSGAYWRGNAENDVLTRLYAISFPDKEELKEYLHVLEEAKKRDHKVLGPKLGLFALKEEAPGMPFILPQGMIVWKKLLRLMGEMLDDHDYIEIKTPSILIKELWEKSGHWENYREHMYIARVEPSDEENTEKKTSSDEDRLCAIKPMNCPGCMLYYKGYVHSYRSLPLRVAEIGNVHRFEPSGALSGLFRCRSFHQDDAHIFMKPSDIKGEILGILEFTKTLYGTFNLDYHLELSTRPVHDTIGSDEDWEITTNALREALEEWGQPYKVNEGDGAFYGPKIDIHIKDALGRTWQCGTVQLDMSLPERFELEYTAEDGQRKRPVMLHRAIFGSIERFFGILIEHFAGRFPLWMSPRQIRILTVADRHAEHAQKLQKLAKEAGFICDVDATGESVGKKVRKAQIEQVNYILTVGDAEVENNTASLRTRNNLVVGEVEMKAFLEKITEERDNRLLESPYR